MESSLTFSPVNARLAMKRRAENFPVASWFLPRQARRGLLAFYSFARHADDIADSTILPREKKLALLLELNRALAEGAETSLPEWARDYRAAVNRGEVSLRHGTALLSAFLQDATKARYDSWQELIDYCMRSAAPVGRAVLELHREWHADIKASDALCNSLQILNHLQDLKADFRDRQRIYFPISWFENPDYLAGDYAAPDIRQAINRALERVEEMLEEAERLPHTIAGFRARAEVCTVFAIAHMLAEKLRHCDPIGIRIQLSRNEKILCLLKGFAHACFTGRKKQDGFSVTRASRTSFFWPMLKLPRRKREAMFALYAFCRATDDAVDDAASPVEAQAHLAFWRHEVAALYSDNPLAYPAHPATRALLPAIRGYGLKREHFDCMLDGLALDARGAMCCPSLYQLDRYCYGVASCVGLLSVRIFGCTNPNAETFALHLGKALQLINILRDVKEDAGRGRIYLAAERLERYGIHGLTPENILERRPELIPVLKEMGNEAREHFALADGLLPPEDRPVLKTALAMQRIYTRYLAMLEAQDFDIAAPRVRLSGWQKLKLAL